MPDRQSWRSLKGKRKMTPQEVITDLGLGIKSTFVPWSQSRNRAENNPSLNWKVTLTRNGRDVLSTDYMAGMAHAPSYKQGVLTVDRYKAIANECESGRSRLTLITPKPADVLYSLVMDSDVLDSSGFEEWAKNLGYDPDSRKAEAIWKVCLDIALKLRAAIGEDGLTKLREAFQDY
jgi:hypothetical protein